MAEFGVQRRDAVMYVGLPVSTTMDRIATDVSAGFAELDAWVAARGIETVGAGLIRYRTVARDVPFTVEVGHALARPDHPPATREPFLVDTLPGGHFAVAAQHGPYAWIGGLTRELMTWGDERGMDYALTTDGEGIDTWDCWYETYPEAPATGAQGLEGPVEVCLMIRA